jgi:hypothetical protein
MNPEEHHQEDLLGPDFARRVVLRVRKVKRRRRIYRWVVSSAAAGALAAAIVWLPGRNSPSAPSLGSAVRYNPAPEPVAVAPTFGRSETYLAYFYRPLAFFFPSATAVGDLQPADVSAWHSYDPWWNPNP